MSSHMMSSMKKILPVLLICLLMLAGGTALYVPDVAAEAPAAAAAAAPKADSGDTAWILASSALVMLMTLPGLALFYGGLTRRKNILSTLMHCFITSLPRQYHVGVVRIQPVVRPRCWRGHREP